MKSTINRLTFAIGVLVFMHLYGDLTAQCAQKIEVSGVIFDEARTRASVEIRIIADEAYEGQLLRIDGTHQTLTRTFSGSGEQSFSFSDLDINNEVFYRVVIEYTGEEKFLCKRRVKDILLTDTK